MNVNGAAVRVKSMSDNHVTMPASSLTASPQERADSLIYWSEKDAEEMNRRYNESRQGDTEKLFAVGAYVIRSRNLAHLLAVRLSTCIAAADEICENQMFDTEIVVKAVLKAAGIKYVE